MINFSASTQISGGKVPSFTSLSKTIFAIIVVGIAFVLCKFFHFFCFSLPAFLVSVDVYK